MTDSSIEKEYVHTVYSRLATYQQKQEPRPGSPRIWPNVKKFMDGMREGDTVIDIGCGEAKYHPKGVQVLGIDTCTDVLITIPKQENVNLVIGDAMGLPFRDSSCDGILFVSVLHHFTTQQRRLQALIEAMRCLREGGRMLICVWAFEQPNASFPSQDILVPWKMHEQALNGRLPSVKFHMDSTKEQRVIRSSIPITINQEQKQFPRNNWLGNVINKVQSIRPSLPSSLFGLSLRSTSCPPRPPSAGSTGVTGAAAAGATANSPSKSVIAGQLPPATPHHLMPNPKATILSGIRRWSPMLGRRLASLLISVEEQLADEMSHTIMQEAILETMATVKDVTFYRYYHVFRKGELESLIQSIPQAMVVQSSYEHANWCIIVEKTRPQPVLDHD